MPNYPIRDAKIRRVTPYTRTVLLVDDSEADRKLFGRLLERAGFRVIATGNPDEALAKIVAGEIGCIVTDQAMKITGTELVTVARGVRSDVGVVFLSGNPDFQSPAGTMFVDKNKPEDLPAVVARCMSKWFRE